MYASKLNEVRQLGLTAFPDYKGRTFEVKAFNGPMRLDSYWSGGSRDYWAFVDMANFRRRSVGENGTPFVNGGQVEQISELPVNVALVLHCISCGKDLGLTVYVNAEQLTKLLPPPAELTLAERIVLWYTASRKSSYNGRNRAQMAFDDSGIPRLEWETAKLALIRRKLLNSAGAITEDGRNAVGSTLGGSPQWPKSEVKPTPRQALVKFCKSTVRWIRISPHLSDPSVGKQFVDERLAKLNRWSTSEKDETIRTMAGKCYAAINRISTAKPVA